MREKEASYVTNNSARPLSVSVSHIGKERKKGRKEAIERETLELKVKIDPF